VKLASGRKQLLKSFMQDCSQGSLAEIILDSYFNCTHLESGIEQHEWNLPDQLGRLFPQNFAEFFIKIKVTGG